MHPIKNPLWIFILLLLVAVGIIFSQGRLITDLSGFVPDSNSAEQRLVLSGIQQGPAARIILLAVGGGEPSERVETSRAFLEKLKIESAFLRAENGVVSDWLNADSLLLRYRYLLDPRPAQQVYSTPMLSEALQLRMEEFISYGGRLIEQQLRSDPTAAIQTVLSSWSLGNASENIDGIWQSADQKFALLLVESEASGTQLDTQTDNLALLHSLFNEVAVGDVTLAMTGAPVFAVVSRDSIQQDVRRLSITATILLVGILLLAFRSIRLVLLAIIPLLSAVIAGAASVIIGFGDIHAITVAFGVTLLGVALDYPIHLYSHIRHGDLGASAKRIWPTLRLSAATTGIGYAALLLTEFRGLAQLGLFNLVGLVVAAAVTRWVLPRLAIATPEPRGLGLFEKLSRWHIPRSSIFIIVTVIVGAWLLQNNRNSFWDDSLAAISPLDSELLNLDRTLRQSTGAVEVSQALVIQAQNVEQVLQQMELIKPLLDKLTAAEVIQSYQLGSDWLPSQNSQRQRQQSLPNINELRQRLDVATDGLGLKATALQPFLESIQNSYHLEPLTLDQIQDTPLALRLNALLRRASSGWQGVIPLTDVSDDEPLRLLLQQSQISDVTYIDSRKVTEQMLSDFRGTAIQRLLWGGLLMVMLITWVLRSGTVVFWVVVPIVSTLLVCIAILRLLGNSLGLFDLIALLLVAGICVDYALFFAGKLQTNIEAATRARTLQSITISSISTVTVFCLLAQSPIPVLHKLGLTVTIGVCCGYILTFIGSRAGVRN